MPLPKLSPLQSRVAVSLTASVILLVLWFLLSSPHFAYAADADSQDFAAYEDSSLLNSHLFDDESEDLEVINLIYEAIFPNFDRGIVGRAPAGVTALANNVPELINVPLGQTVHYMFPNSSLWGPYSDAGAGLPSPVGDLDSRRMRYSERRVQIDVHTEPDDFIEEEYGLRKRQVTSGAERTLYITFNTCLQPAPNNTAIPPPQLELYVSLNSNNTTPGPDTTSFEDQIHLVAIGGAAAYTVNATGDVFIGVTAPNTSDYTSVYNVEIAASIDAPFHNHITSEPNLFLIDSDSRSALLVTDNLTTSANSSTFSEWMNLTPPFVVFASNQNDTLLAGVENSYCGLENYAQIAATQNGELTDVVQTGMTDRGLGRLPKQQFYFNGLNGSSSYYGILAMNGNSTAAGAGVVGGGGTVWQNMNFTTLSDGNCEVIFNLSFCDQVAYAVPSNPNTFPTLESLAAFYDNATQAKYKFFDYALQQIPCDTSSDAQYSLARTCSDCAYAYQEWLCSVTIPRCTDFSSPLSWLQERNILQPYPNGTSLSSAYLDSQNQASAVTQSRNPDIDSSVQPGPYKEVLPCQDLCYNIVQSCPAAMGFSCPQRGMLGFNTSYGLRPDGSPEQEGQITCNYPGAAYYLSEGPARLASQLLAVSIIVTVGLLLL